MDERKKREIYGGDEERETYMPSIIKLNQLKKTVRFYNKDYNTEFMSPPYSKKMD